MSNSNIFREGEATQGGHGEEQPSSSQGIVKGKKSDIMTIINDEEIERQYDSIMQAIEKVDNEKVDNENNRTQELAIKSQIEDYLALHTDPDLLGKEHLKKLWGNIDRLYPTIKH